MILLPEEPAVRGAKPGIARVSVYADDQLKATVAITDSSAYAPVSRRPARRPRKPKASDEEDAAAGISLYQSLYETALKQGVPRSIIDVLTRVFANDGGFPARDRARRFNRDVLFRTRRRQSTAQACLARR